MIAGFTRGTQQKPLPLLPSGPGGVHGVPLREARLSSAPATNLFRTYYIAHEEAAVTRICPFLLEDWLNYLIYSLLSIAQMFTFCYVSKTYPAF
jgi:hypothetical protein